jgi:hypothetical protein
MDAAAITFTFASPSTIARAETESAGQCLPSSKTSSGRTDRDSTARRMARRLACKMFKLSISSTLAQATDQASALFLMMSASRSRSRTLKTLESAIPVGARRVGSNTTAAAQTGPASGPRPASSTPQIRRTAATAEALP